MCISPALCLSFVHSRWCWEDSAPCVTSRRARISRVSLQAETRGEADSWDALFARELGYRSALLRDAFKGVGSALWSRPLPPADFPHLEKQLQILPYIDGFYRLFGRSNFHLGVESCKFTLHFNIAFLINNRNLFTLFGNRFLARESNISQLWCVFTVDISSLRIAFVVTLNRYYLTIGNLGLIVLHYCMHAARMLEMEIRQIGYFAGKACCTSDFHSLL